MIRFDLPAAPSTNNLYATATDADGVTRRHLVRRAREWKTDAVARVRVGVAMHYGRAGTPPAPEALALHLRLHWRAGRRRDVDNQKLLIDAVAAGLGVDDSAFRALTVLRVDLASTEDAEYVEVGVEPLAAYRARLMKETA